MAIDAFYEAVSPDTFLATPACAGPWDAAAQHAGPVSALLARAFERHEPVDGQALSRVTVDIFRPVPVAPVTLRVRTVRPGRRVTLVEGVAEVDGREVVQARGWRVAASPAPATTDDAVPDLPDHAELSFWPGAHAAGYVAAMEWRFVTGAFTRPGPAQVWMRPRLPLVAGEETSPFGRTMVVADSGNGVSGWLDPTQWLFVNVDFTVA
ncbi:MAG: thioesterase family protein, partial [Micromonosporaceae bacterium]